MVWRIHVITGIAGDIPSDCTCDQRSGRCFCVRALALTRVLVIERNAISADGRKYKIL